MKRDDFYAILDEMNSIHEAGHAVITYVLDAGFIDVMINDPADERWGIGRSLRCGAVNTKDELTIILAGAGAELMHMQSQQLGSTWSERFRSAARKDWKEAQNHIQFLSILQHTTRRLITKEAKNTTLALLKDNWKLVLDVARLLREKRVVTNADIAAIEVAQEVGTAA